MDDRATRHEKILARQLAKWALVNRIWNPHSKLWKLRVKQALVRLENIYEVIYGKVKVKA